MSRLTESAGEMVVAAMLAVLAIYVFTVSLGMPKGSFGIPGPGVWPLGLSILLGVGAAGVGGRAWLQWRRARRIDPHVVLGRGDVVAVSLALAGVALFFERAGFLVTALVFLVFLYRILSRRSWAHCAVVALATTAGLYALFNLLIGVSLPAWKLG